MFTAALAALALAAAPADTAPSVVSIPRLAHVEEVKAPNYAAFTLVLDTLPSGDVLAPLFNRNERYFKYLAQHAPTPGFLALVGERRWEIGPLRAVYDSLLRHDSAYNAAITATAGRYLASRGKSLAGYDPARPLPVVSMDEVVRVAVRFFYPDVIQPDGTILTHVCVNLNGVRDLRGPHHPALEAFLFDAIFQATDPGMPLEAEWKRIGAEMNRAGLSGDTTVLLGRAQGFFWSRMEPSPVLRQTIRAEYERRRDFLPFVIAPDSAMAE
ncbi:MAG TPA: hypothetical protein VF771_03175 [Longimicrobiaceae bacterium]